MSRPSTALTDAVDASLARLAAGPPGPARLEAQLRQLAKWRSVVLGNTQAAKAGERVVGGPFAGMAFPGNVAEGARVPRLLGCYEAGLHPVIETAIARAYPQMLILGCAEGYYAVGLALRCPESRIHARDSSPTARALCAALADANDVAGRLQIGGAATAADLALCAAAPTFVLCDIEGAEAALLDPAKAPALAEADILVEVHEAQHPGLLAQMSARFQATHHITRIDRVLRPDLLPPWAEALSDLDRLLLLWEWREDPTPWLWMERR
jgi:hypothetical protein